MMVVTFASVLLALVTAERLGELWLARRNTARLLERGAVEHAPGHYPLIVALHGFWLTGLWVLAWNAPVNLGWLAIFGALQVMRVWVLATLGARWTTRIIVLPSVPLVATGPYRFISHPNYVVVVGELLVLPLAFGLPLYALAFSAFNAAILFIRVRAENAALVLHVKG